MYHKQQHGAVDIPIYRWRKYLTIIVIEYEWLSYEYFWELEPVGIDDSLDKSFVLYGEEWSRIC